MPARTNYDQIAPNYDARYAHGLYDELSKALRAWVSAHKPESILEAGCDTGYWLTALAGLAPHIYGVDASFGMLRQARERGANCKVVHATAAALPFAPASFDLVFALNAIHHFGQIEPFIAEARRALRPRGALVTLGMDPHHGRDKWCVYDYFPEVRPTDLARYPSSGQIADAMLRAGFKRVECTIACRFAHRRIGAAVFDDPELRRDGCSQMALLTDEQYAAGIERMKSDVRSDKSDGPQVFEIDIAMMMLCGEN
ncbi:MAG: class I SAM-dependent methyltransferase [Candidatus Binataceae bacterium]